MPGAMADRRSSSAMVRCASDRRLPLAICAAFLVIGMIFMFFWNPLVHHVGSWNTGGDLWGIFRGAHYVGWGFPGGIYTSGTGIVTFPGMAILLAPIAMLVDHFT